MSSKHTLKFSASFSLILSLLCLSPMQPAFASYNSNRAQDQSPAYKEGMTALRGNNYEKAAELFQQAAADKPDFMWSFYYLGECFLKLKRFDEAANAYQQALLIKPNEAAVHYQLGKTYLEMGDPETARKEYRWLQEQNQELALYLSDLFPPDNPASQPARETAVSSATAQTAVNTTPPPKAMNKDVKAMSKDLRPAILYREKAKYTEIARTNAVQGTVVLQVVFARDGAIQDLRVIRGLPDGLTHKAIEAARAIRFNPATIDGEPVSVRGTLEFTFNLY